MTEDHRFNDGDRISHPVKGLGTVNKDPGKDDLVVTPTRAGEAAADSVYVVWDDDRFPVGKVPASEIELVPPAAAAISTGV